MKHILEILRICFDRYNSPETSKVDTTRLFELILEQATKAYETMFVLEDNISGMLPNFKIEK